MIIHWDSGNVQCRQREGQASRTSLPPHKIHRSSPLQLALCRRHTSCLACKADAQESEQYLTFYIRSIQRVLARMLMNQAQEKANCPAPLVKEDYILRWNCTDFPVSSNGVALNRWGGPKGSWNPLHMGDTECLISKNKISVHAALLKRCQRMCKIW